MKLPPLRTLEMSISRDFIIDAIIEKIEQFGFKSNEEIVKLRLLGIPDIIPMHVSFKKDQGVKVTIHNVT